MRCHEFDAHIEGLLSGVVQPEANEHMRQCERCTSYFRVRTTLQNGLRNLAASPLPGPSRATDRAVLEAYRRRQRPLAERSPRRVAPAAHGAQMLRFPRRASAAAMRSYRGWGGVAAAVAVAVLGVGLYQANHLSNSGGTQSVAAVPAAPARSGAPAAAAQRAVVTARAAALPAVPVAAGSLAAQGALLASSAVGSSARHLRKLRNLAGTAGRQSASAPSAEPVLASANPPSAQAAGGASPLMHLASAGAGGQLAEEAAPPAGSTWPGYSNLMYCDPVVCSGPMPVVHIKVPVDQATPSAQPGASNGFVNADVVIGPDGVARAIRVAN